MNLHLFTDVIPVVTDQILWGVNGTIIYQIKCDEVWHDKQKDGRWWRMVKSSRISLNGPRKFGVCNGPYICENPECTKVTTEGVQNLIDFKQEKGRGYTCKCCGYYAHKRYCGCLKVTEYDKDAGLLTTYHQGKHICTAKPDVISKKKYAEANVVDHNLCSTPKEMKIDIIGNYLATGQIEKAWEVAVMMGNDKILERMTYFGENPGQDHISENDIDAFKNIGKLKTTTDQKDELHIYKINCRGINGEPSFIFKTSTEAFKLAIKMDKNQQKEGELSWYMKELT